MNKEAPRIGYNVYDRHNQIVYRSASRDDADRVRAWYEANTINILAKNKPPTYSSFYVVEIAVDPSPLNVQPNFRCVAWRINGDEIHNVEISPTWDGVHALKEEAIPFFPDRPEVIRSVMVGKARDAQQAMTAFYAVLENRGLGVRSL